MMPTILTNTEQSNSKRTSHKRKNCSEPSEPTGAISKKVVQYDMPILSESNDHQEKGNIDAIYTLQQMEI